jgi:hypothetical protein
LDFFLHCFSQIITVTFTDSHHSRPIHSTIERR